MPPRDVKIPRGRVELWDIFPRRRGAAMSPEDKRRLVVISAAVFFLFFLLLVLSFIPAYLYIVFISVASCVVYFHKAEELQLFERLGLNPRRGLSVPPALLRWLPGRTLRGVPATGRSKIRKSDARNCFASPSNRHIASSYYRRDNQTFSDSVFSPRDILMGSYVAKAEESPSAAVRPGGGSATFINPREQLRERLARPNHAVHTPNRRLSFGEPVGTVSRFTITPRRHYPLQQAGTSYIGVMPPVRWDGLCKKKVLIQRSPGAVRSPVTVKIARPDPNRSSTFDHLNSPGASTSPTIGAKVDPCSKEYVLSVLRESRKRTVNGEDKTALGQKSKRSRHDSGERSQSPFDTLLDTLLENGDPSQLVPKPGNLKRGVNSPVLEETTMKRSRASSISSVSAGPVASGRSGSGRNAIHSSYSSSQGYPRRRAASSLSLSPLTSPGGSPSQTPERASKKAREDDATSPSLTSLMKTDKETPDPSPASAKITPKSEAPVATSTSDSGGSGKRRRKIQLITTKRDDQISLPPPPELGYTITVKDLDMEKKAAFSQIQKVLEEPEPVSPAPAPAPSELPSFTFALSTLSSEAAPVPRSDPSLFSFSTPVPETTPTTTATPALTIDLTIGAPSAVSTVPITFSFTRSTVSAPTVSASSISNPLLESLKNMRNDSLLSTPSLLGTTTAAPAVSFGGFSTPATSTIAGSGVVKSESGSTSLGSLFSTPASMSTPTTKPATSLPSTFAEILAQQPSSSSPSLGGGGNLFGLIKPVATPASSNASSTAAVGPTASTNSISNPLLSGFKPIFGPANTTPASTAAEKPTQPVFRPLFGSSTTGISTGAFGQTTTSTTTTPAAPATQNSSMLFGGLSSTQPPAVSTSSAGPPPATQAPSQSLFGGWNATTTSAPSVNASLQFGAAPTTTAAPAASTTTASAGGTNSAFQFGAPKPAPAPQAQSSFTFGQLSANQNSTSMSFGGFGTTANAPATTMEATTTQTVFGSSTMTTSASTFPGATQQTPAASKPFTFGGNSAASPFGFGANASTAAPTFGTTSQPTFGGASSGFPFGNTTTPSAAPIFGASTQTTAPLPAPAPTFGFGGASTAPQNLAPSTPAPPASGGFNFGGSVSGTPFGTPAPATPLSFGANNTENKPAFGTSTPVFGQGSTAMSMPFGSPATPGFGAMGGSPFGASPASFSIGTGSKPSGQRRLQARRQHPRKK
ncbi:nuclear envelope pore membrane protein POM 121 isoform X5 [Misgurnus anguillicaudatus]|uniref:nuclear envelope pore membrane protein POM 121 isoform X5 n=1 Tax=Misgurnus anguillicaudatus TaxID=75329 RepID=UPI003CCF2768